MRPISLTKRKKTSFKISLLISLSLCSIFYFSEINQIHAEDFGSFPVAKRDFKFLFNNHRTGAPEKMPWIGSWWAFGHNGIDRSQGINQDQSPAQRFDDFFGQDGAAGKWERAEHTCDNLSEEAKKGCKGWWGHCDAWSSAAIKEVEPRSPIEVTHPGTGELRPFSVADQKAYLTEMWMQRNSMFAGSTHKGVPTQTDWVFDPTHADAKKTQGGVSAYQSFWDITPRVFFYIMTNYLGVQKTSLIIDRFTGDQVWNQPLAGYRFLPLRTTDLHDPETKDNKTVYPVTLRVKFYWADDGLPHNDITKIFPFEKTTDAEKVEHFSDHYSGRFLKFKLFFDAPVKINQEGTMIEESGQLVGDGIWHHQEVKGQGYKDLDYTHPDFFWMPTTLLKTGRANPYIGQDNVRKIIKAIPTQLPNPPVNPPAPPTPSEPPAPTPAPTPVVTPSVPVSGPMKLKITIHEIYEAYPAVMKLINFGTERAGAYLVRKTISVNLRMTFARSQIKAMIRVDDVSLNLSSREVSLIAEFPEAVTLDKIKKSLADEKLRTDINVLP